MQERGERVRRQFGAEASSHYGDRGPLLSALVAEEGPFETLPGGRWEGRRGYGGSGQGQKSWAGASRPISNLSLISTDVEDKRARTGSR